MPTFCAGFGLGFGVNMSEGMVKDLYYTQQAETTELGQILNESYSVNVLGVSVPGMDFT